MDGPKIVYTTYINTTAERLWTALTDPAFTRRYWDTAFVTDWRPGSAMTWRHHGVTIADPEQVVLEHDPFRRLSYTWHTFTPEWARAVGFDDEQLAKVAAERRSRVTFVIGQDGPPVRLTVVHDDFAPDSMVYQVCTEGWPRLIADLKTLLETGETLPAGSEPSGAASGR